jgi:hypothetical protein
LIVCVSYHPPALSISLFHLQAPSNAVRETELGCSICID